jgi:hypothetical protein
MRIFNLFLLAIFALSACSAGKDKALTESPEGATFIVENVTGGAEDEQVHGTFTGLATQRNFRFRACVKDVAALSGLPGIPFAVREGDREIANLVTDPSSCLTWTETIDFAPTAQETYFEKIRTIAALSVHSGTQVVRLAVNPWRKGAEAVEDLRFPHTISRLTKGQAVATESPGAELVVERVSIDLEIRRSTKAAAEANLRLSFSPKLRRIALNGSKVLEEIKDGKLAVQAQIVVVTANQTLPLTGMVNVPEVSLARGIAQLETQVQFLRLIPKESRLELWLKVAAPAAPGNLREAVGRVKFNRLSGLTLSHSGELIPEPELSLLRVASPAAGAGPVQFGFRLGRVQVEDVAVLELDSTGHPRRIGLQLFVSLYDALGYQTIFDPGFEVEVADKMGRTIYDPDKGGLRWRQAVSFDYFAKESDLAKKIVVRSTNAHYGDATAERTVYLNPWRYADKGNILIDEEFDGTPSPSVADQGKSAELTLPGSTLSFLRRSFTADAELNLSTVRTYRLELDAKIMRMSRSKGWLAPEGVGNGKYLLKILLETGEEDGRRVLDGQIVPVVAENDKIMANVDLRFHDLRYVMSRLILSLELIPEDPSIGLATQPYEGFLEPLGTSSWRGQRRKGSIDAKIAQAREERAKPRPGAEIMRKGLGYASLADKISGIGLSTADLDRIIEAGDEKSLAPLCALFFDPKGWFSPYKRCAKRPGSYLAFLRTEHVRTLHSSSLARPTDSRDLSFSASLSYSESESNSVSDGSSQSYSSTTNTGLKVPLIEFLGIDLGIGLSSSRSWSRSTSFSKSKGKSTSRGASQSRGVSVDEVELALSADVDRCLVLTALSVPAAQRQTYMGCHSSPARKDFRETYFFLAQKLSASSVQDPGAGISNRPLIALIRGKARYQSFVRVAQDPDVTLHVSKDLPVPAAVLQEALAQEAETRYGGFFPGLLTIGE